MSTKSAEEFKSILSRLDISITREGLIDQSLEVETVWEMLNQSQYDRVVDIINTLSSSEIRSLFRSGEKQKITIGPCPDYIDEILPNLQAAFKDIYLYDGVKKGSVLGGILVKSSEEYVNSGDEICFISTITENISDIYKSIFHEAVSVSDLVSSYNDMECSNNRVNQAVSAINNSPDSTILLSQYFNTTIIPTFSALKKTGMKVIWLGGMSQNKGYAIVDESYAPVDDSFFLTFDQLIRVLTKAKLNDKKILLNVESYIHPQWDMKRAAICYLVGKALTDTIHSESPSAKVVQMLYDPIKGGVKSCEWSLYTEASYKKMMQSSQGIIYSSSVEEMGQFIENSVIPEVPRLHFYRYGYASPALEEERYNGLHLALVSMILNEFEEPSRSPLANVAKQILAQGIHIHYYGGHSSASEKFICSLAENHKKFFIVHDPIRDPQKLVESIRRCHGGFALSYHQMFYNIAMHSESLFMQEAMKMFATTSVATSSLVYAAAGLPILSSRDFWGYQRLYENSLYQMEYSEIVRLKDVMQSGVWDTLMTSAWENKDKYDIYKNIDKLNDFIVGL